MTGVMTIDLRNEAVAPRLEVAVAVDPAEVSVSVSPASQRCIGGLPFSVPRSQLYYWTQVWQDGVAVAHAALANGDFVDFVSDDPDDVVHWLFEVDED